MSASLVLAARVLLTLVWWTLLAGCWLICSLAILVGWLFDAGDRAQREARRVALKRW